MRRLAGAVALALVAAGTGGAGDAGDASDAEPEAAERVLAAEPPERVAALLEEKVVVARAAETGETDAGSVVARGLVIFDQPIDRTFQLLAQTSRQREYRPELAGIETVEELPDGSVEEHRLRILFIDIRYRLRNRLERERRRLWWDLAPGFDHDLARVDGSWELYPLRPRRTLGVLTTRVEMGAAMPSFLQDYATRRNLPATLERCRRWVDGDGRIDD